MSFASASRSRKWTPRPTNESETVKFKINNLRESAAPAGVRRLEVRCLGNRADTAFPHSMLDVECSMFGVSHPPQSGARLSYEPQGTRRAGGYHSHPSSSILLPVEGRRKKPADVSRNIGGSGGQGANLSGESLPVEGRGKKPLNLSHPAGLSMDNNHSPALPSPLPSDGRGEGQGEVRSPRFMRGHCSRHLSPAAPNAAPGFPIANRQTSIVNPKAASR